MSHTIVSCYYLLPNNKKRSVKDYMFWISNFLRFCDTPIVMFSDGEIADAMDNMRKSIFPQAKNWLLIRRPLAQLHYSSQEYTDYYMNIEQTRPMGVTNDVMKVWMNKVLFMTEIATLNPFNTSSFVWCDAGCWRNEKIAAQYAPGWPRKQVSALTMAWVNDSLREVKKIPCPETLEDCVKVYSPLIADKPCIAAAIFGGSLECIQTLNDVFPRMLHVVMKYNINNITEQEILAFCSLWLESKMPVDFYDKYRQPLPEGTDEWFLFQTIL